MKYIITFLLISVCTILSAQQTQVIYIDFGDDATPTPAPWNNIITDEVKVTESIDNLTNANGQKTGISFAIDQSNNFNRFANTTGEQVTNTKWNFPVTATQDNLFGHGNFWSNCTCTHAEVRAEIKGLNPNIEYTFVVFGSRNSVTDIRSAKHEFIGATTKSANLNASQNTSNTASVTLKPDSSGKIRLIVSPANDNNNGTQFYFLGVLVITWENMATSVSEETAVSMMKVYPNPIISNSTFVHFPEMRSISIINNLGQVIEHNESVNSDYRFLDFANYQSGVYFISAKNKDGITVTKKVIKN